MCVVSRKSVLPGEVGISSGLLASLHNFPSGANPLAQSVCLVSYKSRVDNPIYSALFSSAGPLDSSSNMPLLPSSVKYKLRLVLSNSPVTPAPTPASMDTICARKPSIPPSIPPIHRISSVSKTLPSTRAPNRRIFCSPLCVMGS